MNELTNDEVVVLEGLNRTGAATLTNLAVRLRRRPEDVELKLKKFAGKGLVEVKDIGGRYDHEVYRVSDRGRRYLQLLQTT